MSDEVEAIRREMAKLTERLLAIEAKGASASTPPVEIIRLSQRQKLPAVVVEVSESCESEETVDEPEESSPSDFSPSITSSSSQNPIPLSRSPPRAEQPKPKAVPLPRRTTTTVEYFNGTTDQPSSTSNNRSRLPAVPEGQATAAEANFRGKTVEFGKYSGIQASPTSIHGQPKRVLRQDSSAFEDASFNYKVVKIKVEDEEFNAPKNALEDGSFKFRSRLAHWQGTNRPMPLEGVTKEEFGAFLKVLAPLDEEEPDLMQSEWIAALHFAHMWDFESVKKQTLNKLSKSISDLITKTDLARKYEIEEWKVPCYRALVIRPESLQIEEARRLSEDFALKIARARETKMKYIAFPSEVKHMPVPPSLFQSYQICQKAEVLPKDLDKLRRVGDKTIEQSIRAEFAKELSVMPRSTLTVEDGTTDKRRKQSVSEDGGTPSTDTEGVSHHLFLKTAQFEVGGSVFTVPRARFVKESAYFREIFLGPDGSDVIEGDDWLVPLDVRKDEFKAFLRVLYPSLDRFKQEKQPLNEDDWVAVLRLSILWGFEKMRISAMEKLESLVTDVVTKLLLGLEHHIEPWFKASVETVVKRDRAPSEYEVQRLGWDISFKIMRIRETRLRYCEATVGKRKKMSVVCQRCKLMSGMDLLYPTEQQVKDKIDAIARSLDGRNVEEDLPLNSPSETMSVKSSSKSIATIASLKGFFRGKQHHF